MIGHQTKRLVALLATCNLQLIFNARPATSTTSRRVLLIQPTSPTHRCPLETLCFRPIRGCGDRQPRRRNGSFRRIADPRRSLYMVQRFPKSWLDNQRHQMASTTSARVDDDDKTTKKKKRREKNSWRTGPARNRAHLNSHQIRRHVTCSDWQTGRSS